MRKISLISSSDVFDAPHEDPSSIHLRKKKKKSRERKIVAISTNGYVIYNGQCRIPVEEFMYNNKNSKYLHMVHQWLNAG